jgi:predicted KAP-like P-loop ATPase
MLTKYSDIDTPVDKPFVNDKLERESFAKNLTLLVQSTNQPFVISIEAPWGWGKTTFIKMWKLYLESLGHTCLYFNAWENDFVEDPLIAFIGEISKALADGKTKGKIGTQLKKLQGIGGKLVRRTIPLAIQIATHGLLSQEAVKQTSDVIFANSDEIAGFISEFAKDQISRYEDDKNGIVEFKKELAKFAKSLSESENKRGPLIFFIDELDRCRPDFSVLLLERVKHVFNAEGIVFILSVDREQIEQSIKSIYGQGMNSDGYLRRFIDFRLRLPTPSTDELCNSLYERFNMKEVFEKRRNGNDEKSTLLGIFKKFASSYQFSPRVIEQCFIQINTFAKIF